MKVLVENFQSIARAELEPTGLTVIVGPSDRGKSALLRAIEGALFNRPGDGFVRTGAKTTKVCVQLPEEEVTWEKGSGVNRFTLTAHDPQQNDTVYSKVGQKAPAPLQALGFRDVLIGARTKEDGKQEGGEWVRPQVAHQFDPVFLLDKPGTFINEVLVKVSRLGVLQTAGRQCGLDLRQAKSELKLRQGDLEKAEAELERIRPIVAVKARVDALRERARLAQVAQQRVEKLLILLQQRARLQQALARPFPAPTDAAAVLARVERAAQLRQLLTRRTALLAKPTLPPPRKVKKTVATKVQRHQQLAPLVIQQRQVQNWIAQDTATATRYGNEVEMLTEQLERLKREARVCPVCEAPLVATPA